MRVTLLGLFLLSLSCQSQPPQNSPKSSEVDREAIKAELKAELRAELMRELRAEAAEKESETPDELSPTERSGHGAVNVEQGQKEAPAEVNSNVPEVPSQRSVDTPPKPAPEVVAAPGVKPDQTEPVVNNKPQPPTPRVAQPVSPIEAPGKELAPAPTPPSIRRLATQQPPLAGKPLVPLNVKPTNLTVRQLLIGTGIDREKRRPVGVNKTFQLEEKSKLYAYVVVKNPDAESHVVVEWRQDKKVRSQVKLKVGHSVHGWRTWSSARIAPQSGQWTVRILDAHARSLSQTTFLVQ